jgi:amino acid transporter
MQIPVTYNKNQTLQALRFHFISKREIKILLIVVNLFAITAAILFYSKKIRPEPFLLGTCVWLLLMVGIWFLLPITVFNKTALFKQQFIASLNESCLRFEAENSYSEWLWTEFKSYTESPNFFHLYLNERSFLLLPSAELTQDVRQEIRAILRNHIGQKA